MSDHQDNGEQKEQDFEVFLETLQFATSLIEPHYFQLPVARREEPVFRERVYCYELYHQLRSALPETFEYKLDGELDKNGHPLIHHSIGPLKPDFLVHERGIMSKNLAVIEVKPITANVEGITKDLHTLLNFITLADYYKAIYLIYGNNQHNIDRIVDSVEQNIPGFLDGSFFLVWHKQPLTPIEIILHV